MSQFCRYIHRREHELESNLSAVCIVLKGFDHHSKVTIILEYFPPLVMPLIRVLVPTTLTPEPSTQLSCTAINSINITQVQNSYPTGILLTVSMMTVYQAGSQVHHKVHEELLVVD